jgi:hypothetical protein
MIFVMLRHDQSRERTAHVVIEQLNPAGREYIRIEVRARRRHIPRNDNRLIAHLVIDLLTRRIGHLNVVVVHHIRKAAAIGAVKVLVILRDKRAVAVHTNKAVHLNQFEVDFFFGGRRFNFYSGTDVGTETDDGSELEADPLVFRLIFILFTSQIK